MPVVNSELSAELWTQVFTKLWPQKVEYQDEFGTLRRCQLELFASEIASFHALRLVSKTFNQIFLDNPQWFQVLYLRRGSGSLQSLRAWAGKHKHKVQRYIAAPYESKGSLWGNATPLHGLHALLCSESALTHLSIPRPSAAEGLQNLMMFTALESCTLYNSHQDMYNQLADSISLSPLYSLSHLRQLSLQGPGTFSHLENIEHLTSFAVCEARVLGSNYCSFATKLESLYMQHAGIQRFHSAGLAGCEQLRRLGFLGSVLGASNRADCLQTDRGNTMVPITMTALTQLEFLEFHVLPSRGLVGTGPFDLDWVTHLTMLTHLVLRVEHACTLPADLSSLANLAELQLLPPVEVGSVSVLDIDWAQFLCLRTVYIGFGVLACDHSFLRLATVKSLSQVSINCVPEDRVSTACLAALSHCFSLQAPHVKLTFDGKSVEDIYAKAMCKIAKNESN